MTVFAFWEGSGEYMTGPGIFPREDGAMEHIELARIINAEKAREVEAALHRRWLLRRDEPELDTPDPSKTSVAQATPSTTTSRRPSASTR